MPEEIWKGSSWEISWELISNYMKSIIYITDYVYKNAKFN